MEDEGEIRLHDDIHVAVAVAIDEGLITPVIRHADRKGLARIASETRDLAERARNRELQPEDWSGSTFSTSNLGMFGIEEFTAIINPPNVCILAIGAIRDVPVVKNGAVVPGKRMKVTLSCDHRVVDGVTGSEFLATVRGYLEDPLTMLL
jgi:pyruvate dehydrogenase E2 component (dihydrolipoamide acetyltransferase)